MQRLAPTSSGTAGGGKRRNRRGRDRTPETESDVEMDNEARLPPPIGISSTKRGMYTYLTRIHRLMVKDPERFAGERHHRISNAPYVNHGFSDEVIDPSARRNGHLPKDWNRAYWLLIAYKGCTHHLLRPRLLHPLRRLRLCLSPHPVPPTSTSLAAAFLPTSFPTRPALGPSSSLPSRVSTPPSGWINQAFEGHMELDMP